MIRRCFGVCIAFLLITPLAAVVAEEPGPGKQVIVRPPAESTVKHNHWVYLPEDYNQKSSHPLLLFLHGAGERGEDQLDRVLVHGPPKLIAQGKHFPFIVVSPQCKTGGWWEAAELRELVDHLESTYKIDPQRLYVTGLSMGGFGTWSMALHEPTRYAAIAPICGGGNAIAVKYISPIQTPIWAFHGDSDNAVPLSESEEMVEAVQQRGGKAKLTVYPNVGHDSWTQTYDNPKLYEWLESHQGSE